MATKKNWLLLLLASLGLSLAVPLALGGLSQFRLLHRLSVGVILLLILLKLISWAFNALRIQILGGFHGKGGGFGEAALTTISAEFAGVTTPGGVGMAATYAFLFNSPRAQPGEGRRGGGPHHGDGPGRLRHPHARRRYPPVVPGVGPASRVCTWWRLSLMMVAGGAYSLLDPGAPSSPGWAVCGTAAGEGSLAGPAPLASGPGHGGVPPRRPPPGPDVVAPAVWPST